MEKVVRNVADIDSADRQALEHLIGKNLAEHQQVIINLTNLDHGKLEESASPEAPEVPQWWNVYEGLSDEEIDHLDQAIRRREWNGWEGMG